MISRGVLFSSLALAAVLFVTLTEYESHTPSREGRRRLMQPGSGLRDPRTVMMKPAIPIQQQVQQTTGGSQFFDQRMMQNQPQFMQQGSMMMQQQQPQPDMEMKEQGMVAQGMMPQGMVPQGMMEQEMMPYESSMIPQQPMQQNMPTEQQMMGYPQQGSMDDQRFQEQQMVQGGQQFFTQDLPQSQETLIPPPPHEEFNQDQVQQQQMYQPMMGEGNFNPQNQKMDPQGGSQEMMGSSIRMQATISANQQSGTMMDNRGNDNMYTGSSNGGRKTFQLPDFSSFGTSGQKQQQEDEHQQLEDLEKTSPPTPANEEQTREEDQNPAIEAMKKTAYAQNPYTMPAFKQPEEEEASKVLGSGFTKDGYDPFMQEVQDPAPGQKSVFQQQQQNQNQGYGLQPQQSPQYGLGKNMGQQQQQQQMYQPPMNGMANSNSNSNIPLTELSTFEDTLEPFNSKDVPIFWHIPKAGGSTVKDVIGSCHRFVMATEWGVTDGHDKDTDIAVVYPKAPGAASADRSPFVNVDTSTVAGIQRAAKMGFADSGLADAVVTPFLWEANELFTQTAKGRVFSVFRHPVDRAVSMFYYLQVATWEPTYSPDLQNWSLQQYATSDRVENNWMVRQLSNTLGGELTSEHLAVAKEVVRRKIMVGLMTKLEESMSRFEQFFRWKFHVNPTNQEACRERLTKGGSNSNSKNKKIKPKKGDAVWQALAQQNVFDIELYDFIEQIYQEQGQLVADGPDKYRMVGATCCKCSPPTFPPEGFTCPQAVLNN